MTDCDAVFGWSGGVEARQLQGYANQPLISGWVGGCGLGGYFFWGLMVASGLTVCLLLLVFVLVFVLVVVLVWVQVGVPCGGGQQLFAVVVRGADGAVHAVGDAVGVQPADVERRGAHHFGVR